MSIRAAGCGRAHGSDTPVHLPRRDRPRCSRSSPEAPDTSSRATGRRELLRPEQDLVLLVSPPVATTWATPGTASRRCRSTQSAAVLGHRACAVRRSAMNRISPMTEEMGAMTGLSASGGSEARAAGASRPRSGAPGRCPFPSRTPPRRWPSRWRRPSGRAGPRGTIERRLHGEGDLGLDLLRRHAVRLGDDGHRGCGEVREDVDRHARGGVAAGEEEQRGPEQHEEAVLQGPADDAVNHGRP